jgi:NAD(P)-dependent dehydrogenase (short-subunit alcohol dehydrogenase family)
MAGRERVALVTGGARRIGLAIVRDLAAHGWAVAIHCHRSAGAGEREAAAIRTAGGRAAVVEGDLADMAAVRGLLPAVKAALGPATLLVNNAALYLPDAVGGLDEDTWRRQFATNLQAPVWLAEAFAAQLPRGAEGNVVNLIDQRVWKLTPKMTSYTLSKAALWAATRTLAQALAPRIRVNAIAPGPTLPNERGGEDGLSGEAGGVLLERRVDLADFGRAVRFLVETRSMTGQMLALDAGQHLAWQTPDVIGSRE